MSVDGWNTLLVLGGIRSGKSEFAESLVSDATSVRYLATSAPVSLSDSPDDPEWAARIATHRDRRPETWATDEVGTDPGGLITALVEAKADETLLVDDLGGWVGVLLDPVHQPADDVKTIEELAAAVRGCAARLVLVSPEVGLSLVPTTPLGRAFADAVGTANRAVAASVDAVVLVVAGQPTWLKGSATATGAAPAGESPAVPPAAAPAETVPDVPAPVALPEVITPVAAPPAPAATSAPPAPDDALRGPTQALPVVRTGLVIQPHMELPLPDDETGPAALDRLATLDVAGTGLGELATVVRFAAATQGTDTPRPWQSVRVLLVQADHAGGASEGVPAGESNRRTAQARLGIGALTQLTAAAGATLQVVDAPAAAAIEDGPALTLDQVDDALRLGWRLAEDAVENGADLLVIAASGNGTAAAAAAVLAATAGAEPAAVLPPVRTPAGDFDDNAWMTRCAAVRDAMQRVRKGTREAKDILAEVGGGDIAVVTGILLGATARRTPVLLDGPVGVAAALVSRDLAGQARHWCLLPDHSGNPAVKLAADVLGLSPVLDLRLDLGEGTASLAALPLLRSAIALAASIPPRAAGSSTPDTTGTPTAAGPDGTSVTADPDGTSWPADGLDATDAASAAVTAGDTGLLAEATGSATGSGTLHAGTGASTEHGTRSDPDVDADLDVDLDAPAAPAAVPGSTGHDTGTTATPASPSDDTTTVLTSAGSSAGYTTSVIPGSGDAAGDATAIIPRTGEPAGDTTAIIPRTGEPAGDTTAVIPRAGGSPTAAGTASAADGGPAIPDSRGPAGDTTAVIPRTGGSTAGAGTASAADDTAATAGEGAASAASPAGRSAEDDPERTAVISVGSPAGGPGTTAPPMPRKDDPEATTVITTGTGTTRAEDDEDSTSWIPGFGNPRRSDDPGPAGTR